MKNVLGLQKLIINDESRKVKVVVVNSGLKMLFYGGLKMSFFGGLRMTYV
ncbi:hypothetical protein [Staphylococcus lutrae]|nr:hypothetical protein [Staphylococcus lutrae]